MSYSSKKYVTPCGFISSDYVITSVRGRRSGLNLDFIITNKHCVVMLRKLVFITISASFTCCVCTGSNAQYYFYYSVCCFLKFSFFGMWNSSKECRKVLHRAAPYNQIVIEKKSFYCSDSLITQSCHVILVYVLP